jgi:A-kinase anchor protein 10
MSRSKSTILNSSVTSTMLEEDPDSIWRRPSSFAAASGNIGHIDSLGRYRSHFEAAPPDPNSSDKSSAAAAIGSKLSKAMKRLVSNGDIDRVQEELAWQMAERIVKDVTDVTMMHTSSSGQQPPKR